MSEQKNGSEVNLQNAKSEEVAKVEQAAEAKQTPSIDVQALVEAAMQKANEVAEKKKTPVAKSYIEQNGLNYDDETVKKALEEYEAKRPKPEQLIQQEREAKEKLAKENEYLAQKLLAAEKGVPSDKIDKYIGYAKGIMGEGKAFKDAIEEVLKDMPVNKPVAMATGTGTTSVSSDDPFLAALKRKR